METNVLNTSVNLVEDLSEVIDNPENAYIEKNVGGDRDIKDFEEDDRIMQAYYAKLNAVQAQK